MASGPKNEKAETNFISELQRISYQKHIEQEDQHNEALGLKTDAAKHPAPLLVLQLAGSYVILTEAGRKIMSWRKRQRRRMVKGMK